MTRSSHANVGIGLCLLVAAVLCLVTVTSTVTAIPPLQWGSQGHRHCAHVAQSLLRGNTSEWLRLLLPETDGSLPPIAAWADSVRNTPYPWSAALHYINMPDGACSYVRSRDCPVDKNIGLECVDGAIMNYTSQLHSRRYNNILLTSDGVAEAIKFLVHFVGDIHQPLHVGWKSDAGGNTIHGQYFGDHSASLHSVWDSNIITWRDNAFGGEDGYNQWLIAQVNESNPNAKFSQNLTTWRSCSEESQKMDPPAIFGACPTDWAQESAYYACHDAYVGMNGSLIVDGFVLGQEYQDRAEPVVDAQLARCGVRLAHVLNEILSSIPLPVPTPPGPVDVLFLMRDDIDQLPGGSVSAFKQLLIQDLKSGLKLWSNSSRLAVESVLAGPVSGMTLVSVRVYEPPAGTATDGGALDPNADPNTLTAANLATRLIHALNSPGHPIFSGAVTNEVIVGSAAMAKGTGGGDDSTNGGGLTDGALIGIGILVGVIISVVVIGAAFYFFFYRHTDPSRGRGSRMQHAVSLMQKRSSPSSSSSSADHDHAASSIASDHAQLYQPPSGNPVSIAPTNQQTDASKRVPPPPSPHNVV